MLVLDEKLMVNDGKVNGKLLTVLEKGSLDYKLFQFFIGMN